MSEDKWFKRFLPTIGCVFLWFFFQSQVEIWIYILALVAQVVILLYVGADWLKTVVESAAGVE